MTPVREVTARKHVADRLPAYVNGTLQAAERAAVQIHLDRCAACTTELATWEAIRAATRSLPFDAAPVTAPVLDRLWVAIDQLEGTVPMERRPLVTGFPRAVSLPAAAVDPPARPDRRMPLAVWRWATHSMATAALVLLTLLVGYVAIGGPRLGRGDEPVLGIPAPESPSVALALEGVENTFLLQGTVETLPAMAAWVGMERTVLDSGTETTLGVRQERGEGPLLFRVESGVLSLHADGPVQVTRVGTTDAIDVEPETDIRLSAGDQGFAPFGVVTRWRNEGLAAVSVLSTGIRSYAGCCSVPYGEEYDEILAEYTYMPPAPPFELMVRRVTLQPGETLAVDAMPDLELLSVESGTLVALDEATPEKPARRAIIDEGTVEQGNFRPGRIFQSADSDPVTMLLLSIARKDGSTTSPGT